MSKPSIVGIKALENQHLLIEWNNGETKSWDVRAYLKLIIQSEESEYWKILTNEYFGEAYLKDGFVTWNNILNQMHCGGDETPQPVFFSAAEIHKFLSQNVVS